MQTSNFQYNRDSLLDTKALVCEKSKIYKTSNIPTSLETFVGRPDLILFWDSGKPISRNFLDVTFLVDEASRIFSQPPETVHSFDTKLERLAVGLKLVRRHTTDYKFICEIDQKEVFDTWQYFYLTVAKWLTHFTEFQKLDPSVKLEILQCAWTVWSQFDHHWAASIHRRNNPKAPKTQIITRRGVMMDFEKVHFDATWLSDYPSRDLNRFFRHSDLPKMDITDALLKLEPTDQEVTFMLAQLSFEYAGKRCQGEILEICEHFQQTLANDIHHYYVNVLRMDNYFDRLAKLMKVNNAIQEKIRTKRPTMEVAKVLNLIKLDFSHPEMFKDSGYN